MSSFIMSLTLLTLSFVKQVHSKYKRSLRWYSVLFLICAIGVGTVIMEQNKAKWLPSVQSFINHKPANATEVSLDELKAMDPIMKQYHLEESIQLSAPHVSQYPELPRGCEVTSLTMLLNHHDVDTDKMTLAQQVKKNPASHKQKNGVTYFGNPHNGFVGDMYNLSNPGLGVYHQPIAQLAAQYVDKERIHDFTGGSFIQILEELNDKNPVWVIINTHYEKLPESYFETWVTENGEKIKVTKKEHSVLITGYDQEYIYFNDPLNRQEKAPIDDFQEAWVQMGRQAISIK
ncbi:peptidase C39 [Pontibacillus litoralis JSM 072002]|uniref:Peptidase C39 n=1 Tax=Pontibacillus litoralis JSM 072002 TaxID=1385512 RepID=A0A0A5G0X6_9BACI|nr:peptidase C39 [Pontibacillus litoralis JSM 072002]